MKENPDGEEQDSAERDLQSVIGWLSTWDSNTLSLSIGVLIVFFLSHLSSKSSCFPLVIAW